MGQFLTTETLVTELLPIVSLVASGGAHDHVIRGRRASREERAERGGLRDASYLAAPVAEAYARLADPRPDTVAALL